ncbi:MAG: ubiquinol-cytochrome c reductase iron-sulfur subunit N-terminal domain-containing protein [Jatrophihabitantaceae bacterium]
MAEHSRRNFLKHASLGAAAVGAATVAPALVASSADAEPVVSGPTHDGPFVAWVKNPAAGEISVLVGESEIVHRDPKLARRLAQIAGRAKAV